MSEPSGIRASSERQRGGGASERSSWPSADVPEQRRPDGDASEFAWFGPAPDERPAGAGEEDA